MDKLRNRARRALADVLPVWCALTVLTGLPYVIAALRRPSGFVFTGVLSAYDDTFSYLAWIRQGADGHLLMLDAFTSEPHGRQFFLPLWAGLGLISRLTGLPAAMVFHAGRIVAALFLLLAARAVARTVVKSRSRIRYTLWLLAFSAGLGWLLVAARAASQSMSNLTTNPPGGAADLDIPEAITFRAAFAQVHLTLGAALFYAATAFVIVSLIQRKRVFAMLGGAMVSLLALVHPFDVTVVGAVAAVAFVSWRWLRGSASRGPEPASHGLAEGFRAADSLRLVVPFAAACVPALAYLLYLYRSNEVGREWSHIISALSPPPIQYLAGFGIVALLAALGFWLLWRRRQPAARILVVWAVIQSMLLYAPVSFQRRLVEGLQLPLSIAASVGVFWLASRIRTAGWRRNLRRPLLLGVMAVASITNVGFIVAETSLLTPVDPRRYVNKSLVDAFHWLSANAEPDSILFSAYKTGNMAPSLSGLRVYIGHYDLTVHCRDKRDQVEAFYTGRMAGVEARDLLVTNRTTYCLYGPFEREIAPEFSPPDCLAPVYNAGDVQLFKVMP
jgi:hypothetical protein